MYNNNNELTYEQQLNQHQKAVKAEIKQNVKLRDAVKELSNNAAYIKIKEEILEEIENSRRLCVTSKTIDERELHRQVVLAYLTVLSEFESWINFEVPIKDVTEFTE